MSKSDTGGDGFTVNRGSFAASTSARPFRHFRNNTFPNPGGIVDFIEYQRKAEERQRMADAMSSDEQKKRSWMSLAEGWLRMVTPTAKKQSAEQKFDATVRDKGTR